MKIMIRLVALFFLSSAIGGESDNIASMDFMRIKKANQLIFEHLKGKGSDFNFIKSTIDPLIKDALLKQSIWFDPARPDEKMFPYLLAPTIEDGRGKSIDNPYFEYALMSLINSTRFKKDEELRQQTYCELLEMFLPSKNTKEKYPYKAKYKFVTKTILNTSPNLNKKALSIIKTTMKNGIPFPKYLLIIGTSELAADEDIKSELTIEAKKINGFNRNDLAPWISLIILAKDGDKWALSKLVEIIAKLPKGGAGAKKAVYMFPYLCMVSQPEIVEQMKNCLSDAEIIDQGDDIIDRYVGMSLFAAEVLYMLVEGFPPISMSSYSDAERKKCMDWFVVHPQPVIKKADLWSNDPISSRMRYLLLEE